MWFIIADEDLQDITSKMFACAIGTVRGQGAPLPPAGLHGGGVQEPRRSRQPDEGQVGRRFKYTVPIY